MALHFSKEEFSKRKSNVLTSMKEQNLDALLMFRQESMYWLTGYDTFGYVFFQNLVLDKISILEIKQGKIKDPEKLKFINNEHSILKNQLENNVKSDEKLDSLYQSLKEINAKLWVIEDDKRQCEKDKDFGEKFIKLSRDIHFLNDERAQIKLSINEHTGSKIKEIKEYTNY